MVVIIVNDDMYNVQYVQYVQYVQLYIQYVQYEHTWCPGNPNVNTRVWRYFVSSTLALLC